MITGDRESMGDDLGVYSVDAEDQLSAEDTLDNDGDPLDRGYTAADVSLGYASTPDKGQGATHDHSLYAVSDRSSLERGYVAVSRGRTSNELFAMTGQAWEEALEATRAHEPATAQRPTVRDATETDRPIERDRDRWLADRIRQLDTERHVRQPAVEASGRQRKDGRGRGMGMGWPTKLSQVCAKQPNATQLPAGPSCLCMT